MFFKRMNSLWRKIQKFFFEFDSDDDAHFHKNFFDKEYYPIYFAFVVYAIIYIIQYVLFGFLWKRIIFAVVVGAIIAIIVLITRKNPKLAQIWFTMFFIIASILLDHLVIFDLKCNEMIFLGIYISILYYNMIKGMNNILSNFAFSFMLMYLSIVLLMNIEDLTTFFGNITICILQAYMSHTDRKHKLFLFEKQTNEKKMLWHIFNKVFPGITIMLKKKNNHFNLEPFQIANLQDFVTVEFINDKGIHLYGLENDSNKIEDFLNKIIMINEKESIDNIQNIGTKKNKKLLSVLFKFIFNKPKAFENTKLSIYEKNNKKMKIFLTDFEWNNEKLIFLYIDDDNLEDQIKKLREDDIKKNELLASVTHDLRSPLNGILAFIKNAKFSESKEEQEKFLSFAEINGNLLMSLINDILDYSSFINNKFNLIKESFCLNSMLNEVINLMSVQATAKNIKLKVETLIKDIEFFSDSRRIKQILINLIGNSIKFTINGYIKLLIRPTKFLNIVKLTIIDTGIGIKKHSLEKLCQPFATFDNDGINKYGIGLGLNICKKFVSLLGPKDFLKILSEEGKGTKISFFLYVDLRKTGDFRLSTENPRKKIKLSSSSDLEMKSNIHLMLTNFSPKMKTSSALAPKRGRKKFDLTRNFENVPFLIKSDESIKLNKKTKNQSEESQLNNNQNCKKMTRMNDRINELTFSSFNSISNESDMSEMINSSLNYAIKRYENNMDNAMIFSENNINLQVQKMSMKEIKTLDQNNSENTLRILIADDNPFNSFVLSSFFQRFKKAKIKYDTASNGLECIKKFQENNATPNSNNFDLIFLDCLMPVKSGYDAAFEIKELIREKKFHPVIIIGVSGLSGVDEETKCIRSGMDRFLSKPVSEDECFSVIQSFLENYHDL